MQTLSLSDPWRFARMFELLRQEHQADTIRPQVSRREDKLTREAATESFRKKALLSLQAEPVRSRDRAVRGALPGRLLSRLLRSA